MLYHVRALEVNVGRLEVEDFNDAVKLVADCYRGGYPLTLNPIFEVRKIGTYMTIQTSPALKHIAEAYYGLKAVVDDRLVGVLISRLPYPETRNIAEVHLVCTAEGYRKRGVGSEMLAEFKRYWLSRDVEKFMAIVFEDNKPALRFFEANGFKRSHENAILEMRVRYEFREWREPGVAIRPPSKGDYELVDRFILRYLKDVGDVEAVESFDEVKPSKFRVGRGGFTQLVSRLFRKPDYDEQIAVSNGRILSHYGIALSRSDGIGRIEVRTVKNMWGKPVEALMVVKAVNTLYRRGARRIYAAVPKIRAETIEAFRRIGFSFIGNALVMKHEYK